METKEWIMIASAVIVAAGWFVTGYLNRKKDIAQKRLEYRLETLEAFLQVYLLIEKNSEPFKDPDFINKLENARSKFQLYGLNDEIEQMEKFITFIESKDLKNANDILGKLVSLVRTRIRKELNYKSMTRP